MKRLITLFAAIAFAGQAWADDFTIGNLKYTITDAEKHEVSVGKTETKPTGDLVIPAEVEKDGVTYSVTEIAYFAFEDCSGLTSVTIPESVTSIGDEAFIDCIVLTEVIIGNSVTSIGDGAFADCYGLTLVTIGNSVEIIGKEAFYGCSGLTSVTIPESVTSIGVGTFSSCSGLTEVIIGNSVTSIRNSAFAGCSGLTSVTIPNSVTSISSTAFSNCSNLTEINVESSNTKYAFQDGVLFNKDKTTIICYPIGKTETTYTIPETVTNISDYAFAGCSGLTSVTIPNSVTSIDGYAFRDCSSLTSITIPKTVTSIGENAFKDCSNLTINCEVSSKPSGWDSKWNGNSSVVWADATPVTETAANAVNIYAYGRNIVVENATEEISVYDAMGKLICRDAINRVRTEIPVNTTGVYIVKVGNIAKRVAIN